MKLSNVEIAAITKKSLQKVENLEKNNQAEYEALKFGAICIKLNLDQNDLFSLKALKELKLKENA